MSLALQPFVGDDAARAVHGYDAGAAAYLLARPGQGAGEPIEPDLTPWHELTLRPVVVSAADAAEALAEVAAAAAPDETLVLVAPGLRIATAALLDQLDRPGDATTVATIEGTALQGDPHELTDFTLLRIDRDQRLVHSVGTARHTVSNPTNVAAGVLRVAAADVPEAVRLWREAAESPVARDADVDPFDLALLALVRGGVRVGTLSLGPFDVARGSSAALGSHGSPWQQRLRGASRGGDGFFSTFCIRPLSRRLTGFGLGHDWSPNVVTLTSLGLGLVAAGLAAVDNRWTWVAAAVLLITALVVDCVDGEIARFRRKFSALGAWLDAVGDRVKEYSLIAAVAWVGVARGEDTWWLAVLALVLVTTRHLEDYAYFDRIRSTRAHVTPDELPVDAPHDLGDEGSRTTLPPRQTRRQRVVFWTKKVMHLPIAERYLLLAIGLLTFEPLVLLWLIVVAVAVALVWTQGGRTAKALLGVDGFRPSPSVLAGHWGDMYHQADLGPVARLAGRVLRAPMPVAFVGALVVLAAGVTEARDGRAVLVVALVVVGVLLVGFACRPPLRDRLAWQLSSVLWLTEAGLVTGLAWHLDSPRRWVVFAYLAAVAWHRYDVVYRLRDTGVPAAPWVTLVTLGTDGRMVLLTVLWAVGVPLEPVLGWGALALIVVYAAESASAWLTWARGRRAQPVAGKVAT